MSSTWPKVVLDPVHSIIPFDDTPCDRLLLDLINTKEFQRLRRIKQLGMSELVFPGSNHSRFAHCIGVMHTERMFLDRIGRVRKKGLTDEERLIVLAAALLHDLGHGPFSHAFEKITGEDHETRTVEIIKDPSTDVNRRLVKHDAALPDRLERFFEASAEGDPGATGVSPLLTQVVSSQLDADRFDYLLRDSYATGTSYGEFDLKWLIQHLLVDEEKGRFYLSRKAVITAEAYVFARYHMYRTVYFHKTTRAAEVMLRLALRRYKELLASADGEAAQKQVVPDAPTMMVAAFSGKKMTLGQYLALDDHTITEFFKGAETCSDPILRSLATGLIHRRLYKAVDATDAQNADVGEFQAQAAAKLKELGVQSEYGLVSDSISDTAYKPYNPDSENQETLIYVETSTGALKEITQVSGPVDELKKRYVLLRYYFPFDVRDQLDAIAVKTLYKGH